MDPRGVSLGITEVAFSARSSSPHKPWNCSPSAAGEAVCHPLGPGSLYSLRLPRGGCAQAVDICLPCRYSRQLSQGVLSTDKGPSLFDLPRGRQGMTGTSRREQHHPASEVGLEPEPRPELPCGHPLTSAPQILGFPSLLLFLDCKWTQEGPKALHGCSPRSGWSLTLGSAGKQGAHPPVCPAWPLSEPMTCPVYCQEEAEASSWEELPGWELPPQTMSNDPSEACSW